ncbi:MAG: DUF3078 domain-containing protein [Muribaculaceae bacterium]|nr:DUF3078 domain-containing protein [Muribaculaceae bacterium]
MHKPTLNRILFSLTLGLAGAMPHATEAQQKIVVLPAPDATIESLVMPVRESVGIVTDPILPPYDLSGADAPFPEWFFLPAVYDHFSFSDQTPPLEGYGEEPATEGMEWLAEGERVSRTMREMRRKFFFSHPELVAYNQALLPQAPTKFSPVIDPSNFSIEMREMPTVAEVVTTVETAPAKKRHWIRKFNVGLQFSQAYVSPNWYQGGNNNLNVLGNIYYNVKLNQEFHPKLLFETTAQYKLGMNSAPDDSIHSYNISDDLFQVNTTFGIKAARRWYYSFTAQFKTQLLNSYNSNTHDMRSSLLSPGELTAGIGMTYNYATPKKNFTFDASIAPISYSLRTCISDEMDETAFGIKPGHKTVSKFGSSAEVKIFWKIASNISLNSRVWFFTDYDLLQADWENTLVFDINRFLTTQIFCHARYDSKTPRVADSQWSKLQLKEILSIGFTYKFSTI